MFLPGGDGNMTQIDCSPQTARDIDVEAKKLLDAAYVEAKGILGQHREKLDIVAGELIAHETIDGAAFRKLLGLDEAVKS